MFKTPVILPIIYPSLVWEIETTEKVVYLTFDDGPIPDVTEQVLDILKDHNAKATFFCIGDNIAKYPDILRKVISENHSVGNHTFNHLNGWKTNHDIYIRNTEMCSEILSDFQLSSTFFRPPYGRISQKQIKSLAANYQIIMWSVLSKDYNTKIDKKTCFERTLKFTKSGSIVVFHDSLRAAKNMLYVLPKLLEKLSHQGYRFEVLPSVL